MMDPDPYVTCSGPVDARYLAFLETVSTLRPSLHRYCARMTGSVLDGEDVVQEALIGAYRKLEQFGESRPLKPWLVATKQASSPNVALMASQKEKNIE
jgi:RNA polymerase sigma-70 factor, ECF subfamily